MTKGRQKIDMIGLRFGLLTVEREATPEEMEHIKVRGFYYLCRCACGNTCIVRGTNLRNGSTKSCGCMRGRKIDGTKPTPKKRESNAKTAFQLRMKKYSEVKGKLCEKYGRKCLTSPLGKCPLAKHDCYSYSTIIDLYNNIGNGARKPLVDTIKQAAKEFNIEV